MIMIEVNIRVYIKLNKRSSYRVTAR